MTDYLQFDSEGLAETTSTTWHITLYNAHKVKWNCCCTSILRPSTTAPFIASRAASAFMLLANVTKPKPCMQRSR